jgi:methionyl aminopeptidase
MNSVCIHKPQDIELARAAGHAAAKVLSMINCYITAGISTKEVDRICHDFIINSLKVTPANIGYHGYGHATCISVNHTVCHGVPSDRKLKQGDIVNIDVSIIKDGWYGDTSRMYFVDQPSVHAQRLADVTYHAMIAGIEKVSGNATLGDVGSAIQKTAEAAGFSVVREYCGHGIGKIYHTSPQVLHYGNPGEGMRLRTGMIFTIEPMLNSGKAATSTLADGWTVVTKDRSLSAQWEHTVAVTEHGFDVLTPWPEGTGKYAEI